MIEYLSRSKYHTELHLTQYGIENCIPGHFFGPAVRNHYLLHFILDGEGTFEVGGNRYNLVKGQGFLICPDVITYYQADVSNPWVYCWIGFNGTLAELLLRQAGLSKESPILHHYQEERVSSYLQMMTDSKDCLKARDTRLTGLLYSLLAMLIESGPIKSTLQTESRADIYVAKVVDFIENNYAQVLSVEDIAYYIGLNRSYLCSLFKGQMNSSIQEYLIRYRVNKACEMMFNAELSIGDISRSVGYNDPLLFSKIFKKIMGISPKYYRSQMFDPPEI